MALRPETLRRLMSGTRTTTTPPPAVQYLLRMRQKQPDIISKQSFERRWGDTGGPIQAERELRERQRGLQQERQAAMAQFQQWAAQNPLASPKQYLAERLAEQQRARDVADHQEIGGQDAPGLVAPRPVADQQVDLLRTVPRHLHDFDLDLAESQDVAVA